MISAYPKIMALGTRHTEDIFNTPVEITEKVDGSQFAFGKVNQELQMRSKGAPLYKELPENHMFYTAVQTVLQLQHRLQDNVVYYGEYLRARKHNSLTYNRVPQRNIALFGALRTDGTPLNSEDHARYLGLDHVRVLYQGTSSPEHAISYIGTESALGGCNIEGVVVKNYREILVGGQLLPVQAAKFVSEEFKEVHRKEWKKSTTGGGWQEFIEGYRTEARWRKAIQHAKESGEFTAELNNIGPLIRSIQEDIKEEEQEVIQRFLWKQFSPELFRRSTAGFAEWYKENLAKGEFNE